MTLNDYEKYLEDFFIDTFAQWIHDKNYATKIK